MKYRIVYPDGTTASACYLIGYDEYGKPILRRGSTTSKKPLSAIRKAEILGILSYFSNLHS